MQLNNLVRLFSSRIWVNPRRAFPSNQPNCSITVPAYLSESVKSTLPEKPKRPMNTYIRYIKSVRSTLQAKNPTASSTDISKLAAMQWQVLDSNAKAKLEEEFKKEQAVWIQKNAKYLSQLTDKDKEQIRQNRLDKSEEKAKREHRKRVKELGKPKRPMNGFLLYCMDQKPMNLNREQNRKQIKELAQKWANMSDSEKEPYNSRGAAAKAKYREDMKRWEEEMAAQNNFDVIRRQNIIISPKKESKSPKKDSTRP